MAVLLSNGPCRRVLSCGLSLNGMAVSDFIVIGTLRPGGFNHNLLFDDHGLDQNRLRRFVPTVVSMSSVMGCRSLVLMNNRARCANDDCPVVDDRDRVMVQGDCRSMVKPRRGIMPAIGLIMTVIVTGAGRQQSTQGQDQQDTN